MDNVRSYNGGKTLGFGHQLICITISFLILAFRNLMRFFVALETRFVDFMEKPETLVKAS